MAVPKKIGQRTGSCAEALQETCSRRLPNAPQLFRPPAFPRMEQDRWHNSKSIDIGIYLPWNWHFHWLWYWLSLTVKSQASTKAKHLTAPLQCTHTHTCGPPNPRKAVLVGMFVRHKVPVTRSAGQKYALSTCKTARSITPRERSRLNPAFEYLWVGQQKVSMHAYRFAHA